MKKIPLGKSCKYALVDDESYPYVSMFKWFTNERNYVIRYNYVTGKRKTLLLHRFVWYLYYGVPEDGYVIDHIDRNPLNNCISNLRLATAQENSFNRSKRSDNKSGFTGISKMVRREKRKSGKKYSLEYWRARVQNKDKRVVKNFPFTSEGLEQAKKWVINKRKELFGEFNPDEN